MTKCGAAIFGMLALVIRLVLGAVFLWSGLAKIRQPYEFLSAVYQYELVGPKVGLLIAIILPWLEVFVAICLLAGLAIEGALLVAGVLMSVFTMAIGSALYHRLNITCGCFGATDQTLINYWTLLRALGLFVMAVVGALLVARARHRPLQQASAGQKDSPIPIPSLAP